RKPNVVVAVSEGLRLDNGRYVGEGTQSGATDVFGHKYLQGTGKALELYIKEKIGCKVRSVELNLPQRCAAHIASLTDITESVETGEFAVRAAVAGSTGVMVSSVRGDGNTYSVSFKTEEISGIANAIRCVPDNYINERGNGVTDECLRYIYPLVQGECKTVYKEGLPLHIII
ncbi:MAG: 6-phosphofructokinase, partial [Clostridia bacterium]|nr:6-phosphofructokinase [Clostridia bacterium]